jgi:hypothetical protein
MADKSKGREGAVNLGLSEILARENARLSDVPDTRREETSVFALTDGDLAFDREFVSLAEARKWGVLVSRAEQSVANADDLEARLWWIRGHLGALSLPVSLLAAPFETVCRQLRSDDASEEYRHLVTEIGEIMLTRLNDVGDARQAQRVRDTLVALGLGSHLSAPANGVERRASVPPLSPVFAEPRHAEPAPAVEELLPPSLPRRWWSRGLVSALLASAGVVLVVVLIGLLRDGEVSAVSDDFVVQVSDRSQELPLVKTREVSGSLGALYYSLSGDKVAPTSSQASTQPQPAPMVPAVPKSAAASSEASRSKAQPKHKEMVKTDGPLESSQTTRPPVISRPNEPQLPPPDLALRGDGTGVKEGESRSSFPDGIAASTEGVKVVLVRTHVLVTGSHHARVLSILEPGDRVQVEGTFGRWLRIRSRKGKVGYVFAADVGDVEDFTSPTTDQRE